MRPPSRAAHPTPCTPHPQRRDADTCVTVEEGEPPFCGGSAVTQHGHDAPSAAPPRQRPSSARATVPPQGAPGGFGRRGTPRARPAHRAPRRRPGCSRQPPPKPPIARRL